MQMAHVAAMESFFPTQYSQEDLQRHVARRRSQATPSRAMSLGTTAPAGRDEVINMTGMMGGDSLDDIIMQNHKEMRRRDSLPQPYAMGIISQDHDRSSQMLEFGTNSNVLNGFQFTPHDSRNPLQNSGRRTSDDDDLDMAVGFADMTNSMDLNGAPAGFSSSGQVSNALSIDTGGSFHDLSTGLMNDMMGYVGMDGVSGDSTPMNMFTPHPFANAFAASGISHDYGMGGADAEATHIGGISDQRNMHLDETDNMAISTQMPGLSSNGPGDLGIGQDTLQYGSPTASLALPSHQTNDAYGSTMTTTISASQALDRQRPKHNFQNVYSASGFDMIGALVRVANRKNKEIDIGAVDMSCAFVVCDVDKSDCPIVYVSDVFERLTGYNKHEVLGRNCRFLQAPDGKVMAGVKRQFVDDDSVHYLKTRIKQLREAQKNLINYRKGGQPFMNLLTMIPIPWDTDAIRYIVGFQVDLVEHPASLAHKGSSGSYTVNYSQAMLPRYIWQPPESTRLMTESGQTINRDEVSAILTSFSSAPETEITKRMWDKVLLENTDDVVHVLSLKGLFLYLSPSCRHVLEYDASELVGTALSSVCHPSDIVPVTRELKDTSSGASVNVVYRIRRKKSGYTWFESHGSLCIEQGKGRKCIILVGRERPVYALARQDIDAAGGIGENEFWSKLSTSGMFLFVPLHVRTLLDRQPEDMIGVSIQSLMRPDSKTEFGRCLERARTGKIVVFKHEIMNKRGQAVAAETTLYPGDAAEGQKPTFLMCQTRLPNKLSSRSAASAHSAAPTAHASSKGTPHSDDAASGVISKSSIISRGDRVPHSTTSTLEREHVFTQAGGSGLAIGSQHAALASDDNIFEELKTTRCTSWQFELRQMERSNRLLADELAALLQSKKKRKRRKGPGNLQRDCANCHTRDTPEWRRGPSGLRDLCNSCGLRWAKQNGRVSPRTSSRASGGDAASKHSESPVHSSPVGKEQASLTSKRAKSVDGAVKDVSATGAPVGGGKVRDMAPGSISQPVRATSKGNQDGGVTSMGKIDEAEEPA